MPVELSLTLRERYPNLKLVPQKDGKILSICTVDKKRCLDPKEVEDDYDYYQPDNIFIALYTAYSVACKGCSRNITT